MIALNLVFFSIPVGATTRSKTFNAIADAWIHQGFPSTNYGSDPELSVGWDATKWKDALIRFNLSSQPIKYNKVQFQFYCTWVESPTQVDIDIEELFSNYKWNESTVTWDSGPDLLDGYLLAFITNPKVGMNKIDLDEFESYNVYMFDNFSIWLSPQEPYSITIASRENSLTPPRIVCFYEVSNLPIIIPIIVIVGIAGVAGVLGYFIFKKRRRLNKS